MAEGLCCPPEAITTLLIGYTPLNKKLKKKKSDIGTAWPDLEQTLGLETAI